LGQIDGADKLILAHGFTKKTRKKIHENKDDR
jgi:hypothetical protein